MTDIVGRIREASRLDSDDRIKAFEDAIDALPATLDEELLRQLHLSFDDDTAVPELMFDLVHRLERTPSGDQERAYVSVARDMVARSPSWAETLLMRFLNNPSSTRELIAAIAKAPYGEGEVIRGMLGRIAAGNDHLANSAQGVLTQA